MNSMLLSCYRSRRTVGPGIDSDLTKSYYLIEIWEGHWKFLGFNYYNENGLLVNMQMCALVMGANPALHAKFSPVMTASL